MKGAGRCTSVPLHLSCTVPRTHSARPAPSSHPPLAQCRQQVIGTAHTLYAVLQLDVRVRDPPVVSRARAYSAPPSLPPCLPVSPTSSPKRKIRLSTIEPDSDGALVMSAPGMEYNTWHTCVRCGMCKSVKSGVCAQTCKHMQAGQTPVCMCACMAACVHVFAHVGLQQHTVVAGTHPAPG